MCDLTLAYIIISKVERFYKEKNSWQHEFFKSLDELKAFANCFIFISITVLFNQYGVMKIQETPYSGGIHFIPWLGYKLRIMWVGKACPKEKWLIFFFCISQVLYLCVLQSRCCSDIPLGFSMFS